MKGAGAKCSLYARYRCGLSGLNTYLVCSSCFAAVPFISACRKAALLEADSADVGVTRACSGPSATDLCTKSLWRGCEQKTIYVYDDLSFDKPAMLGYDLEWLRKTVLPVDLDPEFMAFGGRQFPSGRRIFGLFAMHRRAAGDVCSWKNVSVSWQMRPAFSACYG